jgi:hypothetical protein
MEKKVISLISTYPETYIPSQFDENLNLGSEYFDLDDCFNILFCAWSRAGKGVFINDLFVKDIIHRVPSLKNIMIFSPTFKDDKSFAPLRNILYKKLNQKEISENIKEIVDFEVLDRVINKQKKIKEENDEIRRKKMNGSKGVSSNPKKLEKYVILIDDLLDSRAFTSFFGGLSGLCTKNRHYNIMFIFSGQHYTKISPVIWAQCDLIFLGFMHPISDLMFKSLADTGKVKKLKELYLELIKNAPDKTFPFFLMVNNPTKRIWDAILFIDNRRDDFEIFWV